MDSIVSYGCRPRNSATSSVATIVAATNGVFDHHHQQQQQHQQQQHRQLTSTSRLLETSFTGGDYRLSRMCSSPVIVGGVGGGGVRPNSVETDESIVSRSPEADHDPSEEQDPVDGLLDQILLREHGGAISFGNAVQSYKSCFEEPTFQPKTKSKKAEGSLCRVCGDEATGMYFGALVCVPCKTFYLRYAGSNQSFSCKEKRSCAITVASRTNCKFCRFQKCLRVGMHRKERPCQVHIADGQQVCSVCQDVANGVHFGVITCEGCKKFFRRGLMENPSYVCKNNGNCEINPRTRNACRFCRYQKCLQVGMSREAIQMGRPSKPRFDKDSSSQESFGPSALAPFDSASSANRLNRKQMEGRGNLSPGRLAINSAVPSSHPVLTHTVNNQFSMSANSSSYSSEKGGTRFPPDNLQKTHHNDTRWDHGAYQRQQQQTMLNVSSCASSLWSPPIEALNGGEIVSAATTGDGVSPKQELQLFDCDVFAEAEGDGFCFAMDSSDTDGLSHFTDDVDQLLWPRQLSSSSSQQQPMTTDLVVSSSPTTNSIANGCSGLSATAPSTSFHGGNYHEMVMSPSLAFDASVSLEMLTADDATDDAEDAATAASAAVADRSKTSSRRLTDLQFPFKSVFKIVHSSVANELPDTQHCHIPIDIEEQMKRFKHYWLYEETGEDPFIVHYSNIYQEVIAAYKTFVIHSQYVNFLLRSELEKCQSANNYNIVDVQWIQDNVVPFYVELSIRYCRQLPGFSTFDLSDQQTLIRLGQSPSRILAAAVHWYRPDKRDFGDFLSWRQNDQFKRMMVEHAAKIHALDLDLVEASLLNAALIIATDYPNLVNREPIERQHQDLLAAYKTYTTGKLGTPNDRFRTVISHMRRIRHLGFIHYEMTKTKNMMAEDVTQLR